MRRIYIDCERSSEEEKILARFGRTYDGKLIQLQRFIGSRMTREFQENGQILITVGQLQKELRTQAKKVLVFLDFLEEIGELEWRFLEVRGELIWDGV